MSVHICLTAVQACYGDKRIETEPPKDDGQTNINNVSGYRPLQTTSRNSRRDKKTTRKTTENKYTLLVQNGDGKRRWLCGETGRFQRECPQAQ